MDRNSLYDLISRLQTEGQLNGRVILSKEEGAVIANLLLRYVKTYGMLPTR